MSNRILSLTCLLLAFSLSPFGANSISAAPTLIDVTDFTLTFPDGWMTNGTPRAASAGLINLTSGGMATLQGGAHTGTVSDAQIMVSINTIVTLDTMTLESSGHLTLGGKDFFYAQMKKTDTAAQNGTIHIREYVTQTPGYMLTVMLFFTGSGTATVADAETALATLTLHPVISGIRINTAKARFVVVSSLDALGRRISTQNPAPTDIVRPAGVFFARP